MYTPEENERDGKLYPLAAEAITRRYRAMVRSGMTEREIEAYVFYLMTLFAAPFSYETLQELVDYVGHGKHFIWLAIPASEKGLNRLAGESWVEPVYDSLVIKGPTGCSLQRSSYVERCLTKWGFREAKCHCVQPCPVCKCNQAS